MAEVQSDEKQKPLVVRFMEMIRAETDAISTRVSNDDIASDPTQIIHRVFAVYLACYTVGQYAEFFFDTVCSELIEAAGEVNEATGEINGQHIRAGLQSSADDLIAMLRTQLAAKENGGR